MQQQERACLQCSRTISSKDTVVFDDGQLSHLDCTRPRALSAKERALLVYYCWEHAVGKCKGCATHFRVGELASDFLDSRTYVCPRCSEDLTDDVRTHLYRCTVLPREVRRRAQTAREAAQRVVKQSRALCDVADLLVQEAEVALHKRQKVGRRTMGRLQDTVDPREGKGK